MTRTGILSLSFALILAVLLTACAAHKHEKLALEAIEQFHSRFNDSKFLEIFEDSTQEVKAAMSREEFLESMNAMREGQGRVLQSRQFAMDYQSGPDTVKIKLLMSVTFERGEAKEEFVIQISENRAQLAGYKFLGP
jgi:hypothetical protein